MKTSSGFSFLGTFGLTLLAIAGLFTVDTFLAAVDRKESYADADRDYRQAQDLIAKGQDAKAIDHIKDALEIERDNKVYLRTLGQAQLELGRTTNAEKTAANLLEADPADGQASLMMARILQKEGRSLDAISYYHRAVYGRWDQNQEANRRAARFELIDLLARQNSKEDLLAELLAVQASPQDMKVRLQMGELFLQAGSPERAADIFHSILHTDPKSAAATRGIGETEFARGNYRSAQRYFEYALRLAPDDPTTNERLETTNQLLHLDPTMRGLTTDERYQRSLKLVDLTLSEVKNCTTQTSSPDMQNLLDKANAALTAKVTAAKQSEVAESDLDIAEQLWQARKKEECKTPADANRPLALVLARLTQ